VSKGAVPFFVFYFFFIKKDCSNWLAMCTMTINALDRILYLQLAGTWTTSHA
jgi:hypothetical protein